MSASAAASPKSSAACCANSAMSVGAVRDPPQVAAPAEWQWQVSKARRRDAQFDRTPGRRPARARNCPDARRVEVTDITSSTRGNCCAVGFRSSGFNSARFQTMNCARRLFGKPGRCLALHGGCRHAFRAFKRSSPGHWGDRKRCFRDRVHCWVVSTSLSGLAF